MYKREDDSQTTQPKKACCAKRTFNKIFNNSDKVAVLRLQGIIGGGAIKKGLSLEDLEEEIEDAFEVSNLKAVALQINSPGGSPVQSELIYNRIRALSLEKKVPVYSFAEDVAASGGYWLACAGDEIYASANSIVGSIGVIASTFGFVDLIKKMGVERRIYKQGENKAILDPFQKENPKDVEILLNLQKEVHEEFKNLVRTRRAGKIQKSDEDMLFSGEFWTGTSGKKLGLVDEIGDMKSVIKAKFGDKIKYVKVSKQKSWIKRKLGVIGGAFIDGAISSVAEKSAWGRFGL
jgi:signal peptide peptidase SppA